MKRLVDNTGSSCQPHRASLTRGAAASAIAVVIGALVLSGPALKDLSRPGYSPDEEFTLFAVRGVEAGGLPLLPSGLLYDRGLGYTYASWGAGRVAGQSLVTYRWVSLLACLAALPVLFSAVRRIAGPVPATLATALLATALPFWVSASTARFYGPFLLFYLLTLSLLPRPGAWPAALLVVAAAGCRWSHELAFTLGLVPAACVALAPRGQRAWWFGRAVLVGAGLVLAQAVLVGVNYLAPSSGGTMVRRFFLWQVLNLFEKPPVTLPLLLPLAAGFGVPLALGFAIATAWRRDWVALPVVALGGLAASMGQLGVAAMAGVCALTLVPQRRTEIWRAVAAVTAAGLAYWLIALVASGRPPLAAGAMVAGSAFVYPLDLLQYLLANVPILTGVTIAALILRASGLGGPWPREARALHAIWIGWVVWFGLIESGITARYLLVPMALMLSALAVDAAALARAVGRPGRAVASALVAAVAVAVTWESWFGAGPGSGRLPAARPTIEAPAIAGEVLPEDVLACSDELACVLLAGRADAWLTLDDFFRERFVVEREGRRAGVYSGAPAYDGIAPLLLTADRRGGRLLILDVAKDVPGFGNSAPLVERALAREGLVTRTLATGAGVRLLEVLAPQGQAGWGRVRRGMAGSGHWRGTLQRRRGTADALSAAAGS